MTKAERQQSLENARRAVEWLREYLKRQEQPGAPLGSIRDLVAWEYARDVFKGFEILDTLSRRPNAGRPPIPNPSPRTLSQRRYRAKLKQ